MEREIIDYLKFIPFTLEQLQSKSRKRELVYHRFTAMYLLRKKDYSLMPISRFFNRHHSDVIHALKRVNNAFDGYDNELLKIVLDGVEVENKKRVLCKPSKFKIKQLKIRQ